MRECPHIYVCIGPSVGVSYRTSRCVRIGMSIYRVVDMPDVSELRSMCRIIGLSVCRIVAVFLYTAPNAICPVYDSEDGDSAERAIRFTAGGVDRVLRYCRYAQYIHTHNFNRLSGFAAAEAQQTLFVRQFRGFGLFRPLSPHVKGMLPACQSATQDGPLGRPSHLPQLIKPLPLSLSLSPLPLSLPSRPCNPLLLSPNTTKTNHDNNNVHKKRK